MVSVRINVLMGTLVYKGLLNPATDALQTSQSRGLTVHNDISAIADSRDVLTLQALENSGS